MRVKRAIVAVYCAVLLLAAVLCACAYADADDGKTPDRSFNDNVIIESL